MKLNKLTYILCGTALMTWSCSQEIFEPTPSSNPSPGDTFEASAGNADFSKFVTVGNSLTAGFQAGALFNDGQENSLGAILAAQFEEVGMSDDFDQPDIDSENGFNASFSNVGAGVIAGRLYLEIGPTGDAGIAALPGELPTAYTGDKAELNNFGVPGILLGQCLTPATGTPGNAIENPLYTRFASAPGSSTIIGDAAAANGSFFLFWLGNNDVLGYATAGATADRESIFTDPATFGAQYGAALSVLTANGAQGVVGNIPYVTSIPFFTTVPYNAIPFSEDDAATVSFVNSNYAAYNGGLNNLAAAGVITQAEADQRQISFAVGANAIVIEDEDLTDLSAFGLPSIRQTTAQDLVLLPTASVLGTLADPGNPASVIGVGFPVGDSGILTANEVTTITNRIDALNATIEATVSGLGLSSSIAIADVNSALNQLTTAGGGFVDGLLIAPTFAPPAGLFSEDGVHPNSRGYAYTAQVFIDAINAKFGASVRKPDLGDYSATALPVDLQ